MATVTKYVVTAISARINSGVLVLTKSQSVPRQHRLNDLGKGRYEIITPVEFKRGDEFGYEGDLPKALADVLETEEKAKTKAQIKADKAAAEAKAKADAEEAEKKAAEEAAAKAKADAEALVKAEWDSSEELQAQFPEFAEYLASLAETSGN